MEASSNVRHYVNHSDYLKRAPLVAERVVKEKLTKAKEAPSSTQNKTQKPAQTANNDVSPEKVELSSKMEPSGGSHSQAPRIPAIIPSGITAEIPGGVAKVISKLIQVPESMAPKKEEVKEEGGPGVFFISGFRLYGLSSSNSDGIKEMATYNDDGEHYSWSDEDDLFEKITNDHSEGPLILVGHSLGANSAVRIANKLNTAEHGFRAVDLLVTMDAFGFSNDIIPSNVQKNMNFIGHRNVFLNDGPNIARNIKTTDVTNELRDELHTKIDNAPDIQSRIYQSIEGVISRAKDQLDSSSSPWRFENPVPQDSFSSKEVGRET
jgi:hypothetical protein